MVHRLELENRRENEEIRKGQVLRIGCKNYLDFTGFVTEINERTITIQLTAGLKEGATISIDLLEVSYFVEILSCPLFYRFKQRVAG